SLTLTPGDVVRNRPQTPVEPFPYKVEEVSFTNGDAVLSGTLVYPEGWNARKKVPVAILVSGSGLQNRDEELFGHKPFLVISDYLARKGIATLRYDDRGAGKSVGNAQEATTMDFMEDAGAGLDFLRSTGKFGKTGVIGHSEGGEIAFMLAARNKVDFLVSLAGPGVQGDSILLLQNLNALRQAGYTMPIPKETVRAQVKSRNNPWLDYFIDYDPAKDIRLVRCPALILNGGKDTQVEAPVNIPAIESNLPRNRRGRYVSKKTAVKVYPGLNHLFQHCETGQSDEYGRIEETISPEVLSDIAAWINKL
ncbi:MAG: alpha/beta hydrolase, partial [Bacteroidales bacterium]|nr:alpha/beta hydrolase [Bacteroidales bacterium]